MLAGTVSLVPHQVQAKLITSSGAAIIAQGIIAK